MFWRCFLCSPDLRTAERRPGHLPPSSRMGRRRRCCCVSLAADRPIVGHTRSIFQLFLCCVQPRRLQLLLLLLCPFDTTLGPLTQTLHAHTRAQRDVDEFRRRKKKLQHTRAPSVKLYSPSFGWPPTIFSINFAASALAILAFGARRQFQFQSALLAGVENVQAFVFGPSISRADGRTVLYP